MKTLGSIFDRIDLVCRGGGAIAAAALLAMIFIVTYEVLMRYVFRSPTVWVHEVSAYLQVVIGMLGAAYALLYDRHVRVDLVLTRLPRRTRYWLNLVTFSLALIFFFSFLTWLGWTMFYDAIKSGNRSVFSVLRTPFWYTYWLVPAGGLLMCLQLLSRINYTVNLLRGKASPPPVAGSGGEHP